jgi:hypothetical protein
MVASCSALEAIITHALESTDLKKLGGPDMPVGEMAGWSFEQRIAVAERAGLISAGCARLPAPARRYRDLVDEAGDVRVNTEVTAREAKQAAQVFKVIVRDLNPGR